MSHQLRRASSALIAGLLFVCLCLNVFGDLRRAALDTATTASNGNSTGTEEEESVISHDNKANKNSAPTGGNATRNMSETSARIMAGLATARNVVRVGHIGAINTLPNDHKVLNLSRVQLLEEGLLDENLDFEIVSKAGCGDNFEGVAVAAQMYHKEDIRAFIGPYCNAELDAVAKMGSYWNVPIVSYMPTTTALSDRNIYKTLSRTSSKNTNSIAKAVVRLLEHYSWKRVAVVTNSGPVAYERVMTFEEEFRRTNMVVSKKLMLEENWHTEDILQSGLLAELAANARIIVCIFSLTRELSREFMQAISKVGMNNSEYVYILPWLQSGPKDTSPWIGASGEVLQQVKDHYGNAVVVDDVNGFDNTIITTFMSRIQKYGLTQDDIDVTNIFGYLHLYDSLKLYAIAARKLFDGSHGNISYVYNGHLVWNKMRRVQFEGIGTSVGGSTGTVIMDDMADRAPQYAAFYIAPNREKVVKMVNMKAFRISNCDAITNRSGCVDLKMEDVMTGFWPSENGSMPPDEPYCGYRGQRCSYLLELGVGITLICMIVLFVFFFGLYRHCQTRALNKMSWRIFSDDLRLIDEDQAKSLLSLGSANTKMSNLSVVNRKHAILGVNTHVTYHRYPQRRPIKFVRNDLILLNEMKRVVHDNLNPFLGIIFNEKEDLLVVWKFCSRGTVQDIIYNKNMTLDEKFHAAFVRDIVLGLEFLHASPIGYHGSLTPWACVIDRNWSVRLTDYGLSNPLDRWQKEGAITITALASDDDKSQASQRTSVLYRAPETLKNSDVNRRRRTDQKWVLQSQARRQAGDIYAFGMVMYEILFRALPFSKNADVLAIVDASTDGSRHVKPQIQDQMRLHPDLAALLIDCWSENPEIRPSIRRVRLNTEMVLKCKGSLVDQMMRVMEQYANNLEKLVKERTGLLEEANMKADRLLNQLLPPYVANELKLGRPVPPKLFKAATVLFSDIVGFTSLCSNSSPLEVVNMLNGIYSGFDEKIREHHSYKVETIGDAYMVVSGIPEENGDEHVRNIANIALDMREFLIDFEIPHRRQDRIKCRWGFHTGPVAAGVVGLTAPRYCLFGDTVNTSSRMESTGMPELIQLSDASHHELSTHFPEFVCTKRGEVEMKGKGLCTTYWLDRRASSSSSVPKLKPSAF